MAIRLTSSDWNRIFSHGSHAHEETDEHGGAHHFNPLANALDASTKEPVVVPPGDTVYLLGLEADAPDKSWSFFEVALDAIVQASQPSPSLTHVELLIPPHRSDENHIHFATYLGNISGWNSRYTDQASFYLNRNIASWRAIPVRAPNAAQDLRSECTASHVGTPYGTPWLLFKYPFSVPPLRAAAPLLNDDPQTSAHCASLAARCLRRAIPSIGLANSSPWYGPSTLYLEMSRRSRMQQYKKADDDVATIRSDIEVEEESTSAHTLLFESDDRVRALTLLQCKQGVEHLSKRAVDACATGDEAIQRLTQNQLAKGLLRWTLVQHIQNTVPAPGAVDSHRSKHA